MKKELALPHWIKNVQASPNPIEFSANDIRDHSYLIADHLWELDIQPVAVYSIANGGVKVADPIIEYFDNKRRWIAEEYSPKMEAIPIIKGIIPVSPRYDGTAERRNSREVMTITPEPPSFGQILICDDVLDTGHTMEDVLNAFESRYNIRREADRPLFWRRLFVVTHDLKLGRLEKDADLGLVLPDLTFHCFDDGDFPDEIKQRAYASIVGGTLYQGTPWIRYLTHEWSGLSKEDVKGRFGYLNMHLDEDWGKLSRDEVQKRFRHLNLRGNEYRGVARPDLESLSKEKP
ncbi:hypothetical protein HY501_02480 [Candidatus Woesearchaeota archaeon]|nr:hypothetical protein [Candidatus Woesearchaeota archaeon]